MPHMGAIAEGFVFFMKLNSAIYAVLIAVALFYNVWLSLCGFAVFIAFMLVQYGNQGWFLMVLPGLLILEALDRLKSRRN